MARLVERPPGAVGAAARLAANASLAVALLLARSSYTQLRCPTGMHHRANTSLAQAGIELRTHPQTEGRAVFPMACLSGLARSEFPMRSPLASARRSA